MARAVFYSGPGFQLSARVNIPDKIRERAPGIVVCPGGYGLSEMSPLPQVAERLCKDGFVTLQLEYRGFGHCEGPRWRQIHSESVEDVRSALTYLETRADVDPKRLGLWGTSYGGSVVILAAAMDARVRSTLAMVPAAGGISTGGRTGRELAEYVARLEEDRRRKVLTGRSSVDDPVPLMYPNLEGDAKRFWEETRKEAPERAVMRVPLENFYGALDNFAFSAVDAVDKISPRPVCFILAGQDKMFAKQQEVVARAKEPKRLVTLEGASHHGSYWEPHFSKVLEESSKWFGGTLRAR